MDRKRSTRRLAALLAACAAPLAAQGPATEAGPTLVVLDALTLAPIPGAEVFLAGTGTLRTDGDGSVALPATGPELRLSVSALGYEPRAVAIERPEPGVVTLELSPDVAVLEGLVVAVDRLEHLRARSFTPVRVIGERELADQSPGALAAHVRALAGGIGPCRTVAGACGDEPAVLLVDDWTLPFLLSELEDLEPADLYAVEVYPRLGLVRAYTRDFLARAAANPRLVPIHIAERLVPQSQVTAGRAPTFAGAFGGYRLAGLGIWVAPFP